MPHSLSWREFHHWISIVVVLVVSILLVVPLNAESIEEKIRNDPDLSEFFALLQRNAFANAILQHSTVTIFAPINAAFQKYGKLPENFSNLVLYHMSNTPLTADKLGDSLLATYSGNPPLWITHKTSRYHSEIYVNNARILVKQTSVVKHNDLQQVLHKIDELLVPTLSSTTASTQYYNPTAYEFLEYFESFVVHPFRLRTFRQRVHQTKREHNFDHVGGHTFFIPVDEGFKQKYSSLIDEKVIDGHVIANHVLFINPTNKNEEFPTLANSDNTVRVMVSFTQETAENGDVINYVKSHTLIGDQKHSPGVVVAEVVKANIPVKNGVIHLIRKPLMVVDNNVKELLLEKSVGILSSFVKAINDADYKEFYNILERSHDITLFAPSNTAWADDFTLNSIIRNREKFKNILKMHLVADKRLYVEKIMEIRGRKESTTDPRKDLYFDVITSGSNRTVTVEGGGVNASVILADLVASNGIVHIIDRVLGVPFTTVLDKLRSDPNLNLTLLLGRQRGFNFQLNDTTKKFTYFVPRDKAWNSAAIDHPSAIKKLFMPEFSYHAVNILERHLVIADEPFSMEKIIQLSAGGRSVQNFANNRREVSLPTVRGELNLSVQEMPDHTFVIHWMGEKIPVYKPNVACTNGIIHVIDTPFLQEGDIQVNAAPFNTVPFDHYFYYSYLILVSIFYQINTHF